MNRIEEHLQLAARANSTPNSFAHFDANEEIPSQARATRRHGDISYYSHGLGEAVFLLLSGDTQLFASRQGNLRLHARTSDIQVAVRGPGPGCVITTYVMAVKVNFRATPLGALAEALLFPDRLPETARALKTFIQILKRQGLSYPMPAQTLRQSTGVKNIKLALMTLTDTLDAEMRERSASFSLDIQDCDPALETEFDTRTLPQINLATLIHPPLRARSQTTHRDRLTRLTRRGGVALLVGPPGTFKTETSKQVAVERGLHLVIAKGSPGVEDRDFIGAVYPTAAGPAWVDGPISRAFLLAAKKPTLLLIDEVLRYLPETLNVLIGALDAISTAEALAVGIPQEMLSGGERHYLLPLPNGEHLACPVQNLTWVMTTNLGQDHLQTADRLDGALLSRVDLTLEYREADERTARALYLQVAGDERIADVAFETELVTRQALSTPGALPLRALDARKTIALIKEVRTLVEDGEELAVAFMEAFETVALPYCCPRDPQTGTLEEAVKEALLGALREQVLDDLQGA
ncbi:AAA family ATPase [Deinococcus petrolearius]|uniref:AAA family ATPase n=1 Tax=Deinococcus petrolearius TaxID=1751295 RepID=A0ABW1DM13_9DEIO